MSSWGIMRPFRDDFLGATRQQPYAEGIGRPPVLRCQWDLQFQVAYQICVPPKASWDFPVPEAVYPQRSRVRSTGAEQRPFRAIPVTGGYRLALRKTRVSSVWGVDVASDLREINQIHLLTFRLLSMIFLDFVP